MTASTRPDTAQLLAELTAAAAAVRGNSWLADGLGRSSTAVGLLGTSSSPLSALSGAGLGWFTPYVSFLAEPFNQLRGNPGSVSSGAQDFQDAGQRVSSLASSYRDSTGSQTGTWTGSSASAYRDAGSQHADGISALGQAGTTVAGAIAAAGEVVGQVIEVITQLATEAIGQIVPIMTQAVAAAPSTFGQSIVAAIPQCVQIAVDCGQKILGKLAALLASGQNLLKLVQGALAVVNVVKQVISQISQQSDQGTQQTKDTKDIKAEKAADDTQKQNAAHGETGRTSAATSPGGAAGDSSSSLGGSPSGYSSGSSPRAGTQSTDLNSMPRPDSYADVATPGQTRTAGAPTSLTGTSSAPTGFGGSGGFGVVPGAAGPTGGTGGSSMTGNRRALGVGPVTGAPGQDMTAGRASTNSGAGMGGMFGAPAGMGATGEQDKEHQRKYALTEHDEDLFGEADESVVIAPNVIGEV
ncbi:WXG100 family type VII secretion target [Kibdelosporangium phytohabitans]|uniref:PPE family domain-containing protein n=1 Tax=Kibdelosporangium phytohabitans TaxID=860235 RepID=A0A0N9I1S3_9PSEU|nr:hypothetical protein [Kibdelosporangium phytohabitans]ALG08636.1 hypothetical protein AOZ06_18460 [Kibdelosporangium phytohabitans]MBE1470271.1 uncharacterized protein YukE [Kibdelosporangium phytohabitans]